MKKILIYVSSLLCKTIAFPCRLVYPYTFHNLVELFIIKRLRSYWLHSAFANCHNTVLFGAIGKINGGKCITIAEKTRFGDFFYLTTWPERVEQRPSLTIGANCNFGAFVHITCTNDIIIGNNVLTGKWVTISDNNHGDTSEDSLKISPIKRPIVSKGPVVIENDVWIGDKATILAGVHVGKGAVIAANAVVTKDVPAYCVAVGNPARILHTNLQNL